ncbi:hypothetical protein [Streptomyces vietnamensis]|uniref:Uncharacterized protein n=1 Tax=Streptomyces vietnamensis TaxID=362257 RepID=A0A0B5I8L5_9ACTN|nr:hypothetical protein [Streptomyces vietnamensis]AJF70375.1 hypothetical protein SVTN_39975 [Streptomyces vietnamensis]
MTAQADEKRGGLPEDEGLEAFGAAAAVAFQSRSRVASTASGGSVKPDSAPGNRSDREPALPIEAPAPRPSAATPLLRRRGTDQCMVMVDGHVRLRFERYQTAQRQTTGREPTNAVVVRRAVLHAQRHDLYAEMLARLQADNRPSTDEDDDPDGLFGTPEPSQRLARGRVKNREQLSFRPSAHELEVIDGLASSWAFPSRSDFVNEALHVFLPALKRERSRTID